MVLFLRDMGVVTLVLGAVSGAGSQRCNLDAGVAVLGFFD